MVYYCLRWMRGHTPDRMSRRERHGSPDRGQKGKNTMKNWRTDKALYHFTEISRSKKEEYNMIMTGEEVSAWCKMKNEAYGYVPGCGGDKSYQCIAVLVDYIEARAEVEDEAEAEKMVDAIAEKVEQTKTRSAWERGVKAYAEELVEELREAVEGGYVNADDLSNRRLFERTMLNGAADWKQYSEGGCSLCYDGQIAERLCAPWELRKTENGRKDPNPRESWIDVQSRALSQAAQLVIRVAF